MNLGRLNIINPYILAPMSIISDIGFRQLCTDYGAGYTFTEQIFAKEFISRSERLKRKLDLFKPCGIQFLSNSPDELKKAITIINRCEFYPNLNNIRSIDLNLGCPAPKIRHQNLGSELMKENELIKELFSTMKKHSLLPVSAKIRLGVNSAHKKKKPYLRIAKIADQIGLDFITVHGRTSSQVYEGEVDLEAIKEITENIKIPIVGNGNINNKSTADKMLEFCDAIMIGRQAITEPFIFGELSGKTYDKKSEKITCIKKYIEYANLYHIGFQHIKVHIQSLLKDTQYFQQMIDITHCKNTDDISHLLRNII